MIFGMSNYLLSETARDVGAAPRQRQFDVMKSNRRCSDVVCLFWRRVPAWIFCHAVLPINFWKYVSVVITTRLMCMGEKHCICQ